LNFASTADVGRRTVVNGRNNITGWADELSVNAAVGGIEHSSQSGAGGEDWGTVSTAAAIRAKSFISSAALSDWAVAGLVGARAIRASQSSVAEALTWDFALERIVNARAFAEDLARSAGNSAWARVNGSGAGLIPAFEDTDSVSSSWASVE
jgi:hypothetical protein